MSQDINIKKLGKTSMEMAGASISLMRVDTELKEYLAAPADTPFYKQFQL